LMKLCFVLPSVPHYRRGLFQSLSEEEALKDLIVLGGYGSSRKVIKIIENPDGYRVCLQQIRMASLGKIAVKYQQGLLYRIIKERPSHLVMLYHMSVLNHSLVPVICKIFGIKVYFWGSGSGEDTSIRGHDLGRLISIKLLIKKWFYGFFDGIVVYSKKHHERLKSQNVKLPIRVAQNTCDIDPFFKIPIEAVNNRNFLFVGALESVKRLDTLIKALSRVNSSDWNFNIIGAGSQKKYLQDLTQELNLDDKIRFHGALYDEDTMDFWHSASYVVLPGVGGLLINEAMAAGKYVLATSGDGTGEDLLLTEDLLSHDVNESDLAVYIDQLFNLPNSEYINKCLRNRKYASENLRIEKMKNEILNFLMPNKYE